MSIKINVGLSLVSLVFVGCWSVTSISEEDSGPGTFLEDTASDEDESSYEGEETDGFTDSSSDEASTEQVPPSIYGYVYDWQTEDSLSEVLVKLGDDKTATTNDVGYYEFLDVPSGVYDVSFSKDGYVEQILEVQVAEFETDLSVELLRSMINWQLDMNFSSRYADYSDEEIGGDIKVTHESRQSDHNSCQFYIYVLNEEDSNVERYGCADDPDFGGQLKFRLLYVGFNYESEEVARGQARVYLSEPSPSNIVKFCDIEMEFEPQKVSCDSSEKCSVLWRVNTLSADIDCGDSEAENYCEDTFRFFEFEVEQAEFFCP